MPVLSEDFLVQFEQFAETVRREAARRSDPTLIQRTPGVCGGDARVQNTRIPVWTLIALQRLGRSESDLLADFPSLTAADLDAVWEYYRAHLAEIELNIAQNESA